MKHLFTYIKAAQFFPKYCPHVMNWRHKLRKTDGNKQPIDFSSEDKKQIQAGIKKMIKDILK